MGANTRHVDNRLCAVWGSEEKREGVLDRQELSDIVGLDRALNVTCMDILCRGESCAVGGKDAGVIDCNEKGPLSARHRRLGATWPY